MTDKDSSKLPEQCDVAIIGAGPSGLAAATELKKLGVASVIVLEREAEAGGIPRHCGHSPFGMREFKRVLSGSNYTKKLTQSALNAGVQIYLNTTVASISKACSLELSNNLGLQILKAKKILICTGIRETPRSTRLVSGQRPMGIMNTGALQSTIYLKHKRPFNHPVIIGTELVSFSALLSCRHSGAKPVAMIEKNSRVTVTWGMHFLAKLLGVPIYYQSELKNIIGKRNIESIELINKTGETKVLDCDGIVFTGKFIAESSLMRMGHLQVDSVGNPIVDQYGQCSDPDYFATGNMIHPVETAGFCWSHGKQTALHLFNSLNKKPEPKVQTLKIEIKSHVIKYVTPQVICLNNIKQGFQLQLRVNKAIKGRLSLKSNDKTYIDKPINALPERRIIFDIPYLKELIDVPSLDLHFESY